MPEPIAAVVLVSPSRKSVRLHTYVSTEKDGQKKGDRFVAQSGLNGCIPEFAERQFRDNRKRWGKNGDRTVERGGRKFTEGQYVQAYHVIQSFARDEVGRLDPSNPDDWEKAHDLGMALARRLAGSGRMATVTTQIDGKNGCLHNHIVIDSVDKLTGRSFDSANVKHKLLAEAHDEVLLEAGYQQVNKLTNGAEKVEKSELRALAKHVAWRAEPTSSPEPFSVAVLKDRVFDAMNYSTSVDWDSFVLTCENLGVEVLRSTAGNGRGISYRMLRQDGTDAGGYLPGSSGDIRRAAKLGTRFTMDAVEATLESNFQARQRLHATTTQPTNAPTVTVLQRDDEPTPYASALGMGDGVRSAPAIDKTQELGDKSTPGATAPGMPAPAGAPLSQAKKADPFADMWAEWEANREQRAAQIMADLGLGKSLEQIDAEKAAEAAVAAPEAVEVPEPIETAPEPVESQESTPGATALGMPAPADAPLSQGANGEFRSLLRNVRVRDQERQQLIDAMAAFDEQAVAALEAGGMFADAEVPKGVGRKFLDVYGERIDPEVLFILNERETKKEAATELWESAAKTKGPLATRHREKAERMRAEVRAGNYALDEPKQVQQRPKVRSRHSDTQQNVEEDDLSL